MAVDEATWARVRAAYEDARDSIAGVARTFGVSTSAIHRRAKTEGWHRRTGSGRATQQSADGDQVAGRGQQRRPGVDQEDMIARLYGAIDAKLLRLEARLSENGPVSSADSEREARELSNMIRSFEKVAAVAGDLDKRRGKRGRSGAADGASAAVERAADAERMRSEIAERLERLHRGGSLADGARKPDGT